MTIPGPNNGNSTTTQTICSRSERSETAVRIASGATEAGLTYFLITRPDLQAARNEAQVRLEGQFTPVFDELDVLSALATPGLPHDVATEPKIKGYFLGESWLDFVGHNPMLHARVADCETKQRPDLEKKRKKIVFEPCSQIWRIQDNPNAKVTMSCLQPSSGADKDVICQDFTGEVSFENGGLVSLKLLVFLPWEQVLPDIVSKFGMPDAQDAGQTLGVWNTNKYHLVATAIDQGAAVSWITADRYQANLNSAANSKSLRKPGTPNALD